MNVELGKIVGVWGVKGWIKLHSYTRNRIDISQYDTWYLAPAKHSLRGDVSQNKSDNLNSYSVLNCRQQGSGIVAQLDGVTDRDQAMALNGQRIMVKQTDLPDLPEGEYYWHQLIGLEVSNEQSVIGTINSIIETGANDVLVCKSIANATDKECDGDKNAVEKNQPDILIPYVKHVVKEVDLSQGSMLVDWDPTFLQD